jgi:hypothetical protein
VKRQRVEHAAAVRVPALRLSHARATSRCASHAACPCVAMAESCPPRDP